MKYDHIHRADIREMFYNIPSVDNMIAERQLLLIGKVFRNPSPDSPEVAMLAARCNNLRSEQGGGTKYHNKYTLVRNLFLLFKKVHEVHIYIRN